MSKVFVNEKGNAVMTLPYSKTEVTLRRPTGKDIKAIEQASQVDSSSIGTMMMIISLLSLQPKLSLEETENLDAEDITALGKALECFSVFSNMAK